MTGLNTPRSLLGLVLATTTLAVVGLIGQVRTHAQEAQPSAPPPREAALQVGSYDPETVFQQHPAQAELQRVWEAAATEVQQAQQIGDHQRIQQIEQQFGQARGEILEKFHREVTQALPKAAETAGVQVIALQIVYAADEVATRDVTRLVIEAVKQAD